jgi:hypothetical protein
VTLDEDCLDGAIGSILPVTNADNVLMNEDFPAPTAPNSNTLY